MLKSKGKLISMDKLTWFLVLMIHGSCPSATCPVTPYPVTIQMPDEATCKLVRDLNADEQPIECWGKPK